MVDIPNEARQAILQSAIATFAHKGYAGTSVQDILQAAQLSKPTLYYYFENKAGLFRAILDYAYGESFKRMKEAAAAEKTAEKQLVAVGTAIFAWARENQNLMRLVLATVFAAPEEVPAECVQPFKRRCYRELILEIIRAGQASGELDSKYDAKELMHGIFGAISHQIRSHLLLPEGELDRKLAERTVALFLNGARPHK